MRIAIDYDGVIHDLPGIERKHDLDGTEPKLDAVGALWWLIAEGHDVWIFTARPVEEHPQIKKWLEKWGFPKLRITNIKEPATIYLDDRAVRFTNWQDFCKLLG